MQKVLMVEDNEAIVKGLKYSLEQEKFVVEVARTISEAENKFTGCDLVVLDVTLPDGNGFELCKQIKNATKIPVIFLTARDEEQDVVLGFDIGADDYVIKPFRTRELISRINNVLKRTTTKENKIVTNIIEIDLDSTRVYVKGVEVPFTALEYKILVLLYSNIGMTITREKILDKIWDESGNFVEDNTLTVYIKRIRAKLQNEDSIKTIKGIGYRVDS